MMPSFDQIPFSRDRIFSFVTSNCKWPHLMILESYFSWRETDWQSLMQVSCFPPCAFMSPCMPGSLVCFTYNTPSFKHAIRDFRNDGALRREGFYMKYENRR